MGIAYRQKGDFDLALQSYDKALKINPNFIKALYGSATTLQLRGSLSAAIDCYEKVLELEPNNFNAHMSIGACLRINSELKKAIKSFETAIKINPNYGPAYDNLGVCLMELGDQLSAIKSFEKAIERQPDYVESYINLGNSLSDMGRVVEAAAFYTKAVQALPTDSRIFNGMGGAQKYLGDIAGALICYDKSIQLDFENEAALLNRSLTYLQLGDFKSGWVEYEWRKKVKSFPFEPLVTRKPEWTPSAHGSRVLLRAEQGIGDEVLFAATILDLYDRSRELTIQIDERLIPLFERSFPNDIKFCSKKEKIPEKKYDFHISMGSTLQYFRKDLESFNKTSDGFLKADAALSSKLRKKLMVGDCDCLVGISWRGGHDGNRAWKSIELSEIAKTLSSSKIKIINLQYGETDLEIKELADNLGITIHSVSEIDNFKDVDGLSALIDACDHVVSVSTLVVHLAGALGKKTTVLLPFACDWRWGENGTESYWYSSIKLLRQKNISDWTAPIEQLQSILKEDTDKVLDL